MNHLILLTTIMLTTLINYVEARPSYTREFLRHYPHTKKTPLGKCSLCHQGGDYNSYSDDAAMEDYNFKAIENEDSDGDGHSNKEEIEALTHPGNPESYPGSPLTLASDLDNLLNKADEYYDKGRSSNYINHAFTNISAIRDLLDEEDNGSRPLLILRPTMTLYHSLWHYRDFFKGCLFPKEGRRKKPHLSSEKQLGITKEFIKFMVAHTSVVNVYVIPKSSFLSKKKISPCSMAFEVGNGDVLIMQGTTKLP